MKNTNLLEGYRCPNCANEAAFNCSITVDALVTDDSIEPTRFADWDWTPVSQFSCDHCNYSGIASEFKRTYRSLMIESLVMSWAVKQDEPITPMSDTLIKFADDLLADLKTALIQTAMDDELPMDMTMIDLLTMLEAGRAT